MRTIGRGTELKDPTLAMSMAIPWTGSVLYKQTFNDIYVHATA
jgi:hypothetical protein